jgi:S1-C subfamily serine protease
MHTPKTLKLAVSAVAMLMSVGASTLAADDRYPQVIVPPYIDGYGRVWSGASDPNPAKRALVGMATIWRNSQGQAYWVTGYADQFGSPASTRAPAHDRIISLVPGPSSNSGPPPPNPGGPKAGVPPVIVRPWVPTAPVYLPPSPWTLGVQGIGIPAPGFGVRVTYVYPGTPAMAMGIEVNDVIVRVNGLLTQSNAGLRQALVHSGGYAQILLWDHRTNSYVWTGGWLAPSY